MFTSPLFPSTLTHSCFLVKKYSAMTGEVARCLGAARAGRGSSTSRLEDSSSEVRRGAAMVLPHCLLVKMVWMCW